MAIIAKINTQGTIGRATIKSNPKTTIAADTFEPKPNVSLGEVNDVSTIGVQDGYTLIFNSDTGKFEAQPVADLSGQITEISGGTF